jgi:hypothetical protein
MMDVAISGLVAAAQALCGMQSDLGVALHKFQKLLAIDKVDGANWKAEPGRATASH